MTDTLQPPDHLGSLELALKEGVMLRPSNSYLDDADEEGSRQACQVL